MGARGEEAVQGSARQVWAEGTQRDLGACGHSHSDPMPIALAEVLNQGRQGSSLS